MADRLLLDLTIVAALVPDCSVQPVAARAGRPVHDGMTVDSVAREALQTRLHSILTDCSRGEPLGGGVMLACRRDW